MRFYRSERPFADQVEGGPCAGADVLAGCLAAAASSWQLEAPASGSTIGEGLTLFHDADEQNLRLCRTRKGLRLTVQRFTGSYLSLAADVPRPVQARLRPGWRLVVRLHAEITRPLTTFLRLNLDHRGNTRALHEVVVADTGPRLATFDLDAVPDIASSAWLDVIFAHPALSEIRLSGLSLGFEELQ